MTTILVVLVACAPTCAEVKDAMCADTAVDSPEPSGWYWVDQEGTRVTQGPELLYMDDDGYVWQVVVGSATLAPYDVWGSGGLAIFGYDALDCAGDPHASDVPGPRFPFTWLDYEFDAIEDGDLFVAEEDAAPFYGAFTSGEAAGTGDCFNRDVPSNDYFWWPFVPFTGAVPVTSWVPPLEPYQP